MTPEIAKNLIAIAREMNIQFSLNGRIITPEEIFTATGLLPAIARRADQLCQLCLGYGIGVTFEDADHALLGNRVIFDSTTPDVLRYLCILDVLHELVRANLGKTSVVLDELIYD